MITFLLCLSMLLFGAVIGALAVHASHTVDVHAGAMWDKITGYVR